MRKKISVEANLEMLTYMKDLSGGSEMSSTYWPDDGKAHSQYRGRKEKHNAKRVCFKNC